MKIPEAWPLKLATVVAMTIGGLLLLGGLGHLTAVLDARAGQPFDYRFVSLVTTSGILMFPGIVSIATSYWLWQGRNWAYVSCVLSMLALTLYLGLLIYMKTKLPEAATAAGSEVYFFAIFVSVYLIVMLSTLVWLKNNRMRDTPVA